MAKSIKKNYLGAHYVVCNSCKCRPLGEYFNPYCLDCTNGELYKKGQTEKAGVDDDKPTK